MTEVVCIGGTLTTSKVFPLYRPLLESVPSRIPARDRYIPIPGKGLGPVADTVARARQKIYAMNLDTPPVIVGHSQGGVIAVELAVMGLASAVISLAGPHGGIGSLSNLEEVSEAAHDLDSRSTFILNHRSHVARLARMSVPFHVVGATYDWVVPSQYKLPVATHWLDAPKWIPRFLLPIPDSVRSLYSTLPTDHITLPWSSGVKWLVNRVLTDVGQQIRSISA